MEAIATEPRLMPHLHLSLQAGDDLMLKRMKRRHARRRDPLLRGGAPLRPDIAFGADLIAGFPTETEAMFERLAAAGRGLRPDLAARLPLQPRKGTPAARMPQVPGPRSNPAPPACGRRRRRYGAPSRGTDRQDA